MGKATDCKTAALAASNSEGDLDKVTSTVAALARTAPRVTLARWQRLLARMTWRAASATGGSSYYFFGLQVALGLWETVCTSRDSEPS